MKTICFQMISQDTGQLLLLLLLTMSVVQACKPKSNFYLEYVISPAPTPLLRNIARIANAVQCCLLSSGHYDRHDWFLDCTFTFEIQRATLRPVPFDESDEETRPDHDLNMTMLGKPHVRKIHVQPEFCQIAIQPHPPLKQTDALWQVFFAEN